MKQRETEIEGHRSLTRRCLILGGAQLAVLGAVGGRLGYLQITESESLSGLAERNRVNVGVLEPLRGRIFDRNGRLLAENRSNYRILIVREQSGDPEKVLRRLTRIIPMTESELQEKLEQIFAQREFVPVLVAKNATWQQVAAVSANAPALRGIKTDFGNVRHYPFGAELAHVLGYVGMVSRSEREDVRDNDPLLFLPEFRIGKTGVEKSFDRQLRGRIGNRRIEVNAEGREIRELSRVEASPGTDVQISIDRGLQRFAAARIGPFPAAAVVLNVRTGQILASVSVPAFNPNKFASGFDRGEFEQLLQTKQSPLVNRPMQGLYPPGSTFKLVTALAGLKSGAASAEQSIDCSGSHKLSNRTFHCWQKGGHGKVDLLRSLSESCDVYYYRLAESLGINRISAMAKELGLGVRYDLPIPELAVGELPTESWKYERTNQAWLLGDTLNAGIGQGFVLASALQLTVMTARIATGLKILPRLTLSVDGQASEADSWQQMEIPEAHLNLIRAGMFAAVNDAAGTAYESRSVDPVFPIAGKTGTSQVRTITEELREAGIPGHEDQPVHLRDHALFCGFAPYGAPQIAAAVIVENGGSGSKVAAPICRDLLMRTHYGRSPPLEAYPVELRPQILKERQEFPDGDSEPGTLPVTGSAPA